MDQERRTFLKIILLSGGAFLAGRVLGPVVSKCLNETSNMKFISRPDEAASKTETAETSSFKIIENDQKLSICDKTGEEIFQIDKSA